ncbi:hypothetical protein BJ875DRAFT_195104 [Amylocarpus encephaloides]|uniref:Uncharacterized protein n=1 Tax=Amylocarpus encephaloides TaxID=45428 RepID=A0A9P7YNW6_9HELO|nr:hypothetical protein BJ875DRAFT_195104 [Amylocarpus encephaloides]
MLQHCIQLTRQASQIHFNRTGRNLEITEEAIFHGLFLEEETGPGLFNRQRTNDPHSLPPPYVCSSPLAVAPSLDVGLTDTLTAMPSSGMGMPFGSRRDINDNLLSVHPEGAIETENDTNSAEPGFLTCHHCHQIFDHWRPLLYHQEKIKCTLTPFTTTNRGWQCLHCCKIFKSSLNDCNKHMSSAVCRMFPCTLPKSPILLMRPRYSISMVPSSLPHRYPSPIYSLFLVFGYINGKKLSWSFVFSIESQEGDEEVGPNDGLQIRVRDVSDKKHLQTMYLDEKDPPPPIQTNCSYQYLTRRRWRPELDRHLLAGVMKLISSLTKDRRDKAIKEVERLVVEKGWETSDDSRSEQIDSQEWALRCLRSLKLSPDLICFLSRLKGYSISSIDRKVDQILRWTTITPDSAVDILEWKPSAVLLRADLPDQMWRSWEEVFRQRRLIQQFEEEWIQKQPRERKVIGQLSRPNFQTGSPRNTTLQGEEVPGNDQDLFVDQRQLHEELLGNDHAIAKGQRRGLEWKVGSPLLLPLPLPSSGRSHTLIYNSPMTASQQIDEESAMSLTAGVGSATELIDIQPVEDDMADPTFASSEWDIPASETKVGSRLSFSVMEESEGEADGLNFQQPTNVTTTSADPSLMSNHWDPLTTESTAEERSRSNFSGTQQIGQELGEPEFQNPANITGYMLDPTSNPYDFDPIAFDEEFWNPSDPGT